MVATMDLLMYETWTHIPQYFPWSKVPTGKAAK